MAGVLILKKQTTKTNRTLFVIADERTIEWKDNQRI